MRAAELLEWGEEVGREVVKTDGGGGGGEFGLC